MNIGVSFLKREMILKKGELKMDKPEFIYKSKEEDEDISPKFITLDKSYLDKDTFELALQLKEKFGLPTITDLVGVAIHYLDETKDKGDKLHSIMKNIHTNISAINIEESAFFKQSRLLVMEKISEDTYGGVEH